MIKLSNTKSLQVFTHLFILLTLSKAISLLALWYFPSEGIDISIKENYQPMYQRVDFSNMFDKSQSKNNMTASDSNNISITNMVLKGLYGTSAGGYIVIAMKSSPKNTSIVEVLQEYQGYLLKSILASHVIFLKDNKEYALIMEEVETLPFKTDKSENDKNVLHNVSREDIQIYSKNPESIWKDIVIEEVKDKNKISGFKVVSINAESKFASLGLKQGDVITKVNNVPLTSYKEAIDVYTNLDNLHTVHIVLIREKQEKELVYEIY